jgi:hypothetical protein
MRPLGARLTDQLRAPQPSSSRQSDDTSISKHLLNAEIDRLLGGFADTPEKDVTSCPSPGVPLQRRTVVPTRLFRGPGDDWAPRAEAAFAYRGDSEDEEEPQGGPKSSANEGGGSDSRDSAFLEAERRRKGKHRVEEGSGDSAEVEQLAAKGAGNSSAEVGSDQEEIAAEEVVNPPCSPAKPNLNPVNANLTSGRLEPAKAVDQKEKVREARTGVGVIPSAERSEPQKRTEAAKAPVIVDLSSDDEETEEERAKARRRAEEAAKEERRKAERLARLREKNRAAMEAELGEKEQAATERQKKREAVGVDIIDLAEEAAGLKTGAAERAAVPEKDVAGASAERGSEQTGQNGEEKKRIRKREGEATAVERDRDNIEECEEDKERGRKGEGRGSDGGADVEYFCVAERNRGESGKGEEDVKRSRKGDGSPGSPKSGGGAGDGAAGHKRTSAEFWRGAEPRLEILRKRAEEQKNKSAEGIRTPAAFKRPADGGSGDRPLRRARVEGGAGEQSKRLSEAEATQPVESPARQRDGQAKERAEKRPREDAVRTPQAGGVNEQTDKRPAENTVRTPQAGGVNGRTDERSAENTVGTPQAGGVNERTDERPAEDTVRMPQANPTVAKAAEGAEQLDASGSEQRSALRKRSPPSEEPSSKDRSPKVDDARGQGLGKAEQGKRGDAPAVFGVLPKDDEAGEVAPHSSVQKGGDSEAAGKGFQEDLATLARAVQGAAFPAEAGGSPRVADTEFRNPAGGGGRSQAPTNGFADDSDDDDAPLDFKTLSAPTHGLADDSDEDDAPLVFEKHSPSSPQKVSKEKESSTIAAGVGSIAGERTPKLFTGNHGGVGKGPGNGAEISGASQKMDKGGPRVAAGVSPGIESRTPEPSAGKSGFVRAGIGPSTAERTLKVSVGRSGGVGKAPGSRPAGTGGSPMTGRTEGKTPKALAGKNGGGGKSPSSKPFRTRGSPLTGAVGPNAEETTPSSSVAKRAGVGKGLGSGHFFNGSTPKRSIMRGRTFHIGSGSPEKQPPVTFREVLEELTKLGDGLLGSLQDGVKTPGWKQKWEEVQEAETLDKLKAWLGWLRKRVAREVTWREGFWDSWKRRLGCCETNEELRELVRELVRELGRERRSKGEVAAAVDLPEGQCGLLQFVWLGIQGEKVPRHPQRTIIRLEKVFFELPS